MAAVRNSVLILILVVSFVSLFLNVSYLLETASSHLGIKTDCPTFAPPVVQIPPDQSLPTYKDERFHLYSQCLYTAFYHVKNINVWEKVQPSIQYCDSVINLNRDHMTRYKNDDEFKFHMDPIDMSQVHDCHIITLGIGHDVTVETALIEKFKEKCKFQGADPITKVNEEIYKPIGTFFPFAVGNATRVEVTSVKEDPNSPAYTNRNFSHVEFVEFLRDKATVPADQIIDQLLLDIEYAEFSMLDYFYLHNKLDLAGYTICQWNGEFHQTNDENQKSAFGGFMKQIAKDERYLPMHMELVGHIRMYFVNVADQRCFDRYVNGRI